MCSIYNDGSIDNLSSLVAAYIYYFYMCILLEMFDYGYSLSIILIDIFKKCLTIQNYYPISLWNK